MTPSLLQMRGVTKRFGATVALDGVDFAVAAGEVHALVGENGAGKSTLMKILSGALRPDAGAMELGGCAYRPRDPHEGRRAGVAMIYQELSLAPHLSVAENILLGMEPSRLGALRRRTMRERARNALRQLECPDIDPDARVGSLSIGRQQMVEVARAVAVGCRVLVLDEPTSSLSSEDVGHLFRLIRRLRQQEHAVVYISHVLEEVKLIADRISVLRDGQTVGTGRAQDLSIPEIVRWMVGRQVEELYPHWGRPPGEAALTAIGLEVADGPGPASFSLHRGEVLGLAGLVGAGRTELLRAVFGLAAVRQGEIVVGVYAGPASPVRRWAQGVGMVSEARSTEGLALSLSVAENLTLTRLDRWIRPNRQQAASQRWIDHLNIRCRSPWQNVRELSGGNQQKVALARLLHHDVDVWLLDEPTRGIDVASKAQIYQLIDELAGRGKAILMVSSYFPELLGVCDRIAVMSRGRLGPARPAVEWDEHQLMLEATGAG